jgi:hypothetical protein
MMIRRLVGLLALSLAISFAIVAPSAFADLSFAQDQTPIATNTQEGPQLIVPDQVNVRICPSTDCDLVGVLISGQQATAIGRSPGGDWIQIIYPGVQGNVAWVYSAYVVLEAGQSLLPIVEPPPTLTPEITPTIDPTLAAQFNIGQREATRLPTYTPAPRVVQPTFEPVGTPANAGFPPILAILALLVLGLFGTVISILRGTTSGL